MGNQPIEALKRYSALVLGTVLASFSVGRYNIPLFIFIWPMCYLYYLRHTNYKSLGLFLITIGCLVANWLKWQGTSHDTVAWDMAWAGLHAVYQMLPFLIEACLFKYIPQETFGILLYPFSEAAIEFMFSFLPKANNNYFAYALQNNLVLIQCMSLFGTYFLSFFLALFNTVFYYGIQVFWQYGRISKWVFSYITVFVILEIYGAIYIQVLPEYTKKMRITLVPGISNLEYNRETPEDEKEYELDNFVDYIRKSIDLTKPFSTDTVFVAEEAFDMYKRRVDTEFIPKLKALQESYLPGTYINIVTGIDSGSIDGKDFFNEVAVIPAIIDGLPEFEDFLYTKVHPIPETEAGYRHGRKIQSTHMYYGAALNVAKVTTAICYDINFPHFMNWYAFKDHPDIMLVPSWDYDAVSIFQSYMASYRSIENGYSIVKNTIGGTTIVTDFCGRFLDSHKVETENDEYIGVAAVWGEGRKTLFSYIGVFWNYFYILGVFVVAIRGYFVKLEETEKAQRLKTRSSNLETENQRMTTNNN